MTALDPIAALHGPISFAEKNLTNDLLALTEQQAATELPAPGMRTPIAIVAECAAVNGLLAGYLTTGEVASRTDEQRAEYFARFTSRQNALDELKQNTGLLRDAIAAFDTSRWADPITDFFGQPSTPFQFASVAAMHMMYHDGQLNLFHIHNGDTEMHW